MMRRGFCGGWARLAAVGLAGVLALGGAAPAAAQVLAPLTTRDITPEEPRRPVGEPLPTAPYRVGEPERAAPPEERALRPFGAALFDRPAVASGEGPNPEYRVAIGDEVAVRVWGSVEANVSTAVDPQGNIFLPQIGPVPVTGVRSGDLAAHVERHVRAVYRENIGVYATLVTWRTIGVFVTGYVVRPGRYPGAPTETIIDFLGKAGGVDLTRGSFRDITVMRRGVAVARADLYEFLIDGHLPEVQFREADAIVVGPQRPTVAATGEVRNDYLFEFPTGGPLTGADLIRLARPLPKATHAHVQGTRAGAPYSEYLPMDAVRPRPLADQDAVSFSADAPRRHLTIAVSGANIGPSVFVTDRHVRLAQLLDHVRIDPAEAATGAVHIRRQSVAVQQRQSLEAALDRLERALFTQSVMTEGEARIRQTEAEMVARYIERARMVEPDGTVVVVDPEGRLVDLPLEDGDEVVVPERRSAVVVSGEVIAPQALVFEPGRAASYYIRRAGNPTDRGDPRQVIVRRLNGQVAVTTPDITVEAGDEVIVPPKIEFKTFQFAKDLLQVLFQIAVISRTALLF